MNTLITIVALPSDGGTIIRPPGVATYLNYYQDADPGTNFFDRLIYHGQPVTSADNKDQHVNDVSGHFTITASKTINTDVMEQFEKLVGPAQVASAD